MADGPGPLEKALTRPLKDFDGSFGAGNPRTLGEPKGEGDVLVSCRGCGVVFLRSRVAKLGNPPRPDSSEVICPETTCPVCLQTQGWRELADVRFRSVNTT